MDVEVVKRKATARLKRELYEYKDVFEKLKKIDPNESRKLNQDYLLNNSIVDIIQKGEFPRLSNFIISADDNALEAVENKISETKSKSLLLALQNLEMVLKESA